MNDRWINNLQSEPDLDVLEESALAMAQATIQNAMDESDTSRAELARLLNRHRSFVTRILNGRHNLTVKTLSKSLLACGYEIEFGKTPISWNWPVCDEEVEYRESREVPSPEGTFLPANPSLWQQGALRELIEVERPSFGQV